jgi:hypothetical protein
MRSINLTRLIGATVIAAVCLAGFAATPQGPAKGSPGAGKIKQINDYVWVNGKLAHGTKGLLAGSVVRTRNRGQARLEIEPTKSTCTNAADVNLVVMPRRHVALRLQSGELVCTMIAGRKCRDTFKAGPATISSCDPTFAMIVKKRKTVVKVIRGFVVVSGRSGRRGAVLVGRNREVVVPAGHDPQAPVPVVWRAREKRAFATIRDALPANHDNTPPAVKITGAPPRVNAHATATFSFAAAERSVAFTCSLDGRPFHPCVSPTSYRGVAPGSHRFAVAATDVAGNTALASSYSWTIDIRAPVTTITSQQPATTSATSATFTLAADEASVRFSCQLDGAPMAPCSSPATYSGLASGAHTFTARATDSAGNVGPPAPVVQWTVDARVPVVTISSNRAAITNATSVSFTFSADKNPVSFRCQLDSAALVPCSSPNAYSPLAEGQHTFVVQATDALGNVGTTKYVWTIDLTKPSATITSSPPDPEWISTGTGDATFTFTASEVRVVFTCKLDANAAVLCGSPKSYTGLAPGRHTFGVTPTDAAGNVGPTATYRWTIAVIPG